MKQIPTMGILNYKGSMQDMSTFCYAVYLFNGGVFMRRTTPPRKIISTEYNFSADEWIRVYFLDRKG